MTGPSVVAVARIGLELARRTWPPVLRALTAEDRGLNPADLAVVWARRRRARGYRTGV